MTLRERLIETAREMLTKQSASAIEAVDLIEQAGVGRGSLYRNFNGLDGLVRVLYDEMVSRTRADLESIAATVEDAQEAIRCAMRVGFQRVADYGQLTIDVVLEKVAAR